VPFAPFCGKQSVSIRVYPWLQIPGSGMFCRAPTVAFDHSTLSLFWHFPGISALKPPYFGHFASRVGHQSTLIGHQSTLIAQGAILIGRQSTLNGERPLLTGHQAILIGHQSILIRP
jgi:hypothetical protein